MKYVLDFTPDVMHVSMEGEFTFADARRFRRLLSVMMDEHERCEVRLDIQKLERIDSTAIQLMMNAHDIAKKMHITLTYAHPKGQVNEVLQQAAEYNVLNIAA